MNTDTAVCSSSCLCYRRDRCDNTNTGTLPINHNTR